MLNHPNNEIIKIAILEVSDQSRSVLEFYFSTVGKSLYKKVSQAEASAFITDYDYPGAVEHWEEISKTTNKPGIILSISEKNIASTVWLAKPLSAKAMTDAATTIRNMIVDDDAIAESAAPEVAITEFAHEEIEQTHMDQDEFVDLFETNKHLSVKQENAAAVKELETAGTAEEVFNTPEVDKSENYDHEFEANYGESADNNFAIAEEEAEVEIVNEPDVISIDEFTDSSEEIQENPVIAENEEIDALLESLILGEGRKKRPVKENLLDDGRALNEDSTIVEESLMSGFASPAEDLAVKESLPAEDSLIVEDSSIVEDSISVEESIPVEDSLPLKNTLIEEAGNSGLDKTNIEPEIDNPSDNNKSADFSNFDFDSFEEATGESESSVQEKNETISTGSADGLISENEETDFLDFDFESILSGQTQTNKRIEDDGTTIDLANHRDSADDDFSEMITETELSIEKPSNLNIIDDEEDSDILTDADEFLDHIHDIESEDAVIEDSAVPLSAEQELQSLLNEIRVEADKGARGVKSNTSKFTFNNNFSSPIQNKKTKAHEPTNAEKRWSQLCGDNFDKQSPQNSKKSSYTLNKHMLSILLDQIDRARSSKHVLRLKHDDIIIVIDTEFDSIYSNYTVDTEEYVNFCYETVNPENIKVHALDYSEVRLYRKKMETKLQNTHTIESFIWTTSLLTSRGRLLANTDTTKPISLKTWPNLTRIESIPYAMNIAAVFSKHPGSLQDVPKWLNIPHRYVYAFYNGVLALEMVEFDSNKFKASNFDINNNPANSSKERSFFSRLLKRLKA